MQGIWLISYIVLWVLVLGIGVGLVAVGRHIGSILEKISRSPVRGQAHMGPVVGSRLWDDSFPFGPAFPDYGTESNLLFALIFVSRTCPHCKAMIPDLHPVLNLEEVQPVVLTRDEISATDPYLADLRNLGIPYLHATDLFERGQITAVPTTVLVDRAGTVLGKYLGNDVSGIKKMITTQVA